MPKKMSLNTIPEFDSEDAERDFWAEADSTDYIDWSKAERAQFPELSPSTKKISLRLPEALIDDLKIMAHRIDVPYQSLLKVFLAERVEQEKRTQEKTAA